MKISVPWQKHQDTVAAPFCSDSNIRSTAQLKETTRCIQETHIDKNLEKLKLAYASYCISIQTNVSLIQDASHICIILIRKHIFQ